MIPGVRMRFSLLLCLLACRPHVVTTPLGALRVEVVAETQPQVEVASLPSSTGELGVDLTNGIINIVRAVRAGAMEQRLEGAADLELIEQELLGGLREAFVGDAAITRDPAAPLLRLELDSLSLHVPEPGTRGWFEAIVIAEVYDVEGDRRCRRSATCHAEVGAPAELDARTDLEAYAEVVDNRRELEAMSDAEIRAAFGQAARECAQTVGVRLQSSRSARRCAR